MMGIFTKSVKSRKVKKAKGGQKLPKSKIISSPETKLKQEQAVRNELIRLTKIVRKKYQNLKNNANYVERLLEAQAKPIVKGIRDISESIKQEPTSSVAAAVKKEEPLERKEVQEGEEIDVGLNRSLNVSTTTQTTDSPTLPSTLVERYLKKLSNPMMKDKLDFTYGVKPDGKGNVMMGDSKVTFSKTHVNLRHHKYSITPGLLELLFMQVPDKNAINSSDLKTYKEILKETNAHRQMFSAEKPINSNRGKKYTGVISVLFPPKYSVSSSSPASSSSTTASSSKGSGLENFQRYESDVNSLVKRLKILVLSKEAGHTAHDKEINYIITLLRYNNIIG